MEDTRFKLMEAIVRQRTVAVHYNGQDLKIAPHLLYERHGDLFVGALNLSKNWRDDDDRRLGQFKLAGLRQAQLLEEGFDPLPTYKAEPPRGEDTIVMAL